MKLHTSAFGNDRLHLSHWDLIKLFFGATLKTGALVVTAGVQKNGKP